MLGFERSDDPTRVAADHLGANDADAAAPAIRAQRDPGALGKAVPIGLTMGILRGAAPADDGQGAKVRTRITRGCGEQRQCRQGDPARFHGRTIVAAPTPSLAGKAKHRSGFPLMEIGRASWRERVWKYV